MATFQELMATRNQPKPQPRQRNFLESIIGGITDPFITAGKQALDFGEAGLSGNLNNYLTGANNYQTRFQSAEEYDKFNDDPLANSLRSAAGVGAFFVPGGPVLGGAISGGLSAASQDDADLTSILSGAVLGGATGGALKGAGKLLKGAGKGAEKAGTALKTKNLNLKFNKNTPVDQTIAMGNSVVNQLDNVGLPVNPQNVQKLADETTAQFRNTLSGAGANASLGTRDDILNAIINRTDNPIGQNVLNTSPTARANLEDAVDSIINTGGDLNQLFDVKGRLSTNKILDASSPDAPLINRILNNAGDVAREQIQGVVPDAQQYFINQSALRKALPDATVGLNKGDNVPLTGLLGGLEIPGVGAVKRGANNAIGGGLQKTGQIGANLGNMLQSGANQNIARNSVISGILGGMNTPQQEITDPTGQIGSGVSEMNQEAGFEPQQQQQIAQIYRTYAQALLDQKVVKNLQDAYELAPIYAEQYEGIPAQSIGSFGTPKTATQLKITEKQRSYRNAADSAQQALDILNSGQANTGKIANIGNQFNEFFGIQPEGQTAYNAKLAAARTTLQNALLGANITDREFDTLSAAIPQLTDEPRIAKEKIKSFIELTRAGSK